MQSSPSVSLREAEGIPVLARQSYADQRQRVRRAFLRRSSHERQHREGLYPAHHLHDTKFAGTQKIFALFGLFSRFVAVKPVVDLSSYRRFSEIRDSYRV